MKNNFTLDEVKKIATEAMNLGMELRQDQLNGVLPKSGNEILDDFFNELANNSKNLEPKIVEMVGRKFKNLLLSDNDMEVGYATVHIDISSKQLYISNRPYPTIEDAEQGIFWGSNIEKVGCFEIKYRKK